MKTPAIFSGARAAAEEILPLPLLPRWPGGRMRLRQIEGRRRNAERIIAAHCIDRSVGVKAWHALDAETRRMALRGHAVPAEMADAIHALAQALGGENE